MYAGNSAAFYTLVSAHSLSTSYIEVVSKTLTVSIRCVINRRDGQTPSLTQLLGQVHLVEPVFKDYMQVCFSSLRFAQGRLVFLLIVTDKPVFLFLLNYYTRLNLFDNYVLCLILASLCESCNLSIFSYPRYLVLPWTNLTVLP